ncbi:MAG: Flp pilus assembly protein CpaB [Kineosporiaceae bacterium]
MGRRTLLLIASILVAALGTALVWLYVQGADARAQEGQAFVTAYFLNQDMAPGASPEAVFGAASRKDVPANVAATAVTSPQQVNGKVLRDAAGPGQMLVASMFGTSTSSGAQPGRGIITISISDPHRVPAQLKPGAHVAVYALGGKGNDTLKLVNPDITVVSIGSSMQTPSGGTSQVPVTIVGFDADPKQAVQLAEIEASGASAQLYLLGPNTKGAEPG